MSVTYKCDGCGKSSPGVFWGERDVKWSSPQGWWNWPVMSGALYDYCSLQCFETIKRMISERTGNDYSYMRHGNCFPISEKP